MRWSAAEVRDRRLRALAWKASVAEACSVALVLCWPLLTDPPLRRLLVMQHHREAP